MKYMAAPIPRSLRQSRLAHLSACVIGSQFLKGNGDNNLVYDIVMLPVQEFQRMRSNVGQQNAATPQLSAGSGFSPSFILTNIKEITVPADAADPAGFAKAYFLNAYGIIDPASGIP